MPLYLLRPGCWFRFAEENDPALYQLDSCKEVTPFAGNNLVAAIARIRLIGQPETSLVWGTAFAEPYNR